ncbi:uncharacterized protein BDW70DRAFT_97898 [Aspergillus foveolatus]|uniref:uncharacterized protein n=1 Tax=Aspergillus foveolatus TaxID=210207 RepID=UPI003CCCC216
MAPHQDRKRKSTGLVSVEDGLEHLAIVLKVIQLCKGLRPGVEKRLSKDITLFKYGIPADQVEGRARQQKYINFLGELRDHPSMLILCMVGLGLSVIAVTRDEILANLADAIKQQVHIYDEPVLHEIVMKYLQPASIPESSNTATLTTPTIGTQITTQRGQRATEG